MSFSIAFDYRFDTAGFFDNPQARAVLDEAARVWEALIDDEFPDVPAGTQMTIRDPFIDDPGTLITLEDPIDDILIFVSARPLGAPQSLGYFTGTDAAGDVLQSRIAENHRGFGPATDFEPWAGWFVFDTTENWSYDLDTVAPGAYDLLSLTVHGIAHILGFGSSPIFFEIGADQAFDGPNALAVNNGEPIPLGPSLGHVIEGFADNQVLLDPFIDPGVRLYPSDIDLALLADIGLGVKGFDAQGARFEIETDGPETIRGRVVADVIDARAGNDSLMGAGGDDTLLGGDGNDTLRGDDGHDLLDGGAGDDQSDGGAGDDYLRGGQGNDTLTGGGGTDLFEITGGGGTVRIADFDPATETLRLKDAGFETLDAALQSIERPSETTSRLTLSDGTRVDVLHVASVNSPLNTTNVVLGDGNLLLVAGSTDDRMTGGPGNDTLRPGDGADTVVGGEGDDVIESGTSDLDRQDVIFAGIGSDHLRGGYGNDDMHGGEGNDTIEGGFGADRAIGNAGDDVLAGGALSDLLIGNAGADVLNGGFGYDRLNGGSGADRFFHLGIVDHGSDWIQDYSDAEGDILVYGGSGTIDQFQVNIANTANAGSVDVDEAFVIYRPTGQILWALVDGTQNDEIVIRINGADFDLLG